MFYTKSNDSFKYDEFQTIANPVISTKLVKTAYDDASKKKRMREKEFMDDNKFPVEKHYFCDHMMKWTKSSVFILVL